MKTVVKILISVAILAGGVFLMQVLASFKTDPPVRQPQIRPKFVQAQVVQLSDIPASVSAFGRISSAQPISLISEVNGEMQSGNIPFQPGQSFKRGQLIAKIDDRQIRLDLNSAKSDLLNALAQVLPEIKIDFPGEFPKWQQYFESIEFGKKLAPLPEVADSKIKLFLARFNVYKLYFTVQNLEINLQKHFFYAPFDGAITTTGLRVGATARNGTQLGEIINLEDLEVEVPVSTNDLRWVNRGGTIRFTSNELPGEWFGKIKRIGKTIDPQTQTVPVYISITKNAGDVVYDGIFLNAKIPGEIVGNAFVVPNNALYEEQYVYLVKDGRLKYQPVNVVRHQTESVIVNSGLQNGDTLVVELLQGVAPGMPATAELLSMAERSGK